MSEQPNEVSEDQETDTPELTDDEIWEQAGKATAEVTPDPEPEPEKVEEEDEQETIEVEEPVAESEGPSDSDYEVAEVEAKVEEKPKHDYEKRYKDLEREFHKRNEESARMREEYQKLRLERLELENKLSKLPSEPKKAPEPDPFELTAEEQEVAKEFPDILSVARKQALRELSAKTKELPLDKQSDRIEELEKRVQSYQEQQKRDSDHLFMIQNIGSDYRDIDRSEEFYDFVMSSPMRERMMTESKDPKDYVAVMSDFLGTPVGKAKFRPDPVEEPQETKTSNVVKQQRRKAASGLVKNSAPRQEKRVEDMSPEELWDHIKV